MIFFQEGYLPPIVSSAKADKAGKASKGAKGKRKKRSLTALEFSSTSSDPESDEDFKGSRCLSYKVPSLYHPKILFHFSILINFNAYF